MTFTMAQAKRDFARGYLRGANIVRGIEPGKWNVFLLTDQVIAKGFLVDARAGAPREFLTVGAAVSALEQIGFEVELLAVSS